MPVNIINRYIIRELSKMFLITVGALTAVLYLDKFLFIAQNIVNHGVSILEVFLIIIYISPAYLALTIPISVLVASVATFNQFSASNEWVAMKCKHLVIFAKERHGQFQLMDILIADTTQSTSPRIITANQAIILLDREALKIRLKLKKGTMHEVGDKPSEYRTIKFDAYELNLDFPTTNHLERMAMVGHRELSISLLLQQIKDFEKKGLPTYAAKVELSKKFAIPFTCLLFGLLGAPLGIHSSRGGKSGSFAASIVIIFLYYVGLIFMQDMGKSGGIEPYLSVWLPNIIVLGIIIYTSYKMQKDLPFKLIDLFYSVCPSFLHKRE